MNYPQTNRQVERWLETYKLEFGERILSVNSLPFITRNEAIKGFTIKCRLKETAKNLNIHQL